jgi:MazG family protein
MTNMEYKYPREDQKYTIEDLLNIMHELRDKCPWDSAQTHQSLKQYLLEETYEVLEGIDDENWEMMSSELGDLLLQIVFHSEIAARERHFDFSDVVDRISKKLVDRHPHVFGDLKVHSASDVQENWEHSKVVNENRKSILSGIPQQAPALLQAQRLQQKAATVGFDWNEMEPVLEKIEEEWQEFKTAVQKNDLIEIEKEFGDVLFSLVNLARFKDVVAEDALRQTNNKFIRRFQYIERQYNNDPKAIKKEPLETLDKHWNDAKLADE